MYVKLRPKFADASPKAAYGYKLMTDTFDNLVFGGNLDGYSPGGSYCIIKIGGLFDADGIEMVRETIMEFWRKEEYQYQPDDILEMSYCETILG